MIDTYGYNEQGKCWSNYLKKCLSNKTVQIDDSLGLLEVRKEEILKKLREAVDNQLKQGCSDGQASLMKDGVTVLLSKPFPLIPIRKKRKSKRKRKNFPNSDHGGIHPHMVADTEKSQPAHHETSVAEADNQSSVPETQIEACEPEAHHETSAPAHKEKVHNYNATACMFCGPLDNICIY